MKLSPDNRTVKSWQHFSVNLIFASFLIYFSFFLFEYHYHQLIYPHPIEYREGAKLFSTQALLKGINPYALANQPQYLNIYGIVYSWAVYPFARWLGPTLVVHRAVSGLFILLSCLVIFVALKKEKTPLLHCWAATIIFYASCLMPKTSTITGGPHSLGLLLYLLSLLVPYWNRYTWLSLAASLLLGILGFYTKAYFMLGIPYLTVYLFFFVSKKKAFVYASASTILLISSAFLMHHFYECIFNNNFFSSSKGMGILVPGYFIQQGAVYLEQNKEWLIILIQLFLLSRLLPSQKLDDATPAPARASCGKQPGRHFIFFCFLCSVFIIAGMLGQSKGSWMAYYYQLITPFLLIAIFQLMNTRPHWRIFFIPLIVSNLFMITEQHRGTTRPDNEKQWQVLDTILDNAHDVLNSPVIAHLLLERGMEVYDNGEEQYFTNGTLPSPVFECIAVSSDRLMERAAAFHAGIQEKIRAQVFDFLILTEGFENLVTDDVVRPYYQRVGQVPILMPHMRQYWTLNIWKRRLLK